MKKWTRRLTALFLSLSLLTSLTTPALAAGASTVFTGIDTLMIYNPLTDMKRTMSTGSMTGQVGGGRTNVTLLDEVTLSGLEESGDGFYFSDQDALLEELTGTQETLFEDLENPEENPENPEENPQDPQDPEEDPEDPEEDPRDLSEDPENPEAPAVSQDGMAEDGFHFADQDELQEELQEEPPEDAGLLDAGEQSRAAAYTVGSRKSFHYQPGSRYTGAAASFTCLYAGSSCYIWGYGFSNQSIANAMGSAFDGKIFQNDTNSYGTARYIKDGGKLNILIYPMSRRGLCGFFRPLELLTASEMGSRYAARYNHDEAVIHINTSVCTSQYYETYGLVTLAHEYQHLICFSSSLLGAGGSDHMVGTWLNEAMSMQAEEISYPGEVVRAEYISGSYNHSGDIASGQSLYNFATENDIGVYGQVFMFSEYLKKQSGTSSVYKQIHDYWRASPASALTDAQALYSVLPGVRSQINSIAAYPSLGLTAEEEFLSKLNLAFQTGAILKSSNGIYSLGSACGESNPKLFTGTRGSIEGGGRLLVAVRDGSYTVPYGADSRLIYAGFKNGRMVINPTTAANYGHSPAPGYTVQAAVNDASLGSVSVRDNVITVSPVGNAGYDSPAYTVLSGSATVVQSGNTFTVTPASNCTIRINLQGSITVTGARSQMTVGETVWISLTVSGSGTGSTSFTSSDTSVAAVSQSGGVTAVGPGTAVITITARNGAKTSFTVHVTDPALIAQSFDGGSGTEDDPYLVSTPSSLSHLANMTNSGYSFAGQYIRQTANINLNGSAENPWTPIGSAEETPFSGHYDGGCQTITGLYMDSGEIQGLFGVTVDAEIAMLSIDDSSFRGGTYMGAFAGLSRNSYFVDLNTLSHVTVTSGSASSSRIGGVLGMQDNARSGQIGFCSNAGTVDSTATPDNLNNDTDTAAGGIVGYFSSNIYSDPRETVIVACRNEGTVIGNVGDQCGGITGILTNTYLMNSYNTGNITSKGFAGGITGKLVSGHIYFSYNAGAILGTNYGQAAGITSRGSGGGILRCYNCGKITSDNPGYTAGIISWKEGTETGTESKTGVSNCIYLRGSVLYPPNLEDEGASPYSSSQLQDRFYLNQYFDPDFGDTWAIKSGINSGYPVLKAFHPDWDGNLLVYDRAPGTVNHRDLSTRFYAYNNLIEGLRNGERNDRDLTDGDAGTGRSDLAPELYEAVNPEGGAGTATLTIRESYLDTLAIGTHTLTARFGANINVDFDITVQDTPPTNLTLRVSEAPVKDGKLNPVFLLSAPAGETREGRLVMASYQNGKLRDLVVQNVTMNPGRNDVTLSIPYDASAGRTYRVFLMSEENRPLMSAVSFQTPEELLGTQSAARERPMETLRESLDRSLEAILQNTFSTLS